MEMRASEVSKRIDWGQIAPLRLRAKGLAEGMYAGAHRSSRRGPGVEFGGHRPYLPGDDLRWLDRGAMLRHGRLIVREFETDTDRGVRILMDATASMGFRSAGAPCSKFAYAALLAAALTRVALSTGDPVGLAWIGGVPSPAIPASSGRESFERIVAALEGAQTAGDLTDTPETIEPAFAAIARYAQRGSLVVLFSDWIDLPDIAIDRLAAMASRGLIPVGVQVLDPEEVDFPFKGTIRLRAIEGGEIVEARGDMARAPYLAELAALQARCASRLSRHGGFFLVARTDAPPEPIVRQLVTRVARGTGGGARTSGAGA